MAQSIVNTKEELDLFMGARYQCSIDSSQYVRIYPVSGINSSGCEFVISGSREHYLDVSETLIEVKGSIFNQDGTKLKDDAVVYPVNSFASAIWNEIEVFYNGEIISNTNTMNAYKNIIEDTCNFGSVAKRSHLTAKMHFKDKMPSQNNITTINNEKPNDGAVRRNAMIAESKVFDTICVLPVDIFKVNRLLLSGVEVRIRLHRNKDQFLLVAPDDTYKYKLNIASCTLLVRQVKPTESTSIAIEKQLLKSPANYHVSRVHMRNFAIPAGSNSVTKDNLLDSGIPKRLVMVLTTSEAFAGAYKDNPFYFSHRGLSSAILDVNGRAVLPVKVDFENGDYALPYYMQYIALNKHQQDKGNDIAVDEFHKNFFLMWDLTPDYSADEGIKCVNNMGNLRLTLNFHSALTETLTAIIYAETDGVILISGSRKVERDFT